MDNKQFMANFEAFKAQWEEDNADLISEASTMITEHPTPKFKRPKPVEYSQTPGPGQYSPTKTVK